MSEESIIKLYRIPEELITEEDRKRGNEWILTICHPNLVGCISIRINKNDLETFRKALKV